MKKIATLGPEGSDSFQAVKHYSDNLEILLFNQISEIMESFRSGQSELAFIPVYNTREGEVKEYFRMMEKLDSGYWIDNVVLPIHLSLGGISPDQSFKDVRVIIARSGVFKQCEEYIATHMPYATLVSVYDIETAISDLLSRDLEDTVVIETEPIINRFKLSLLDREIAHHNRTRFAVIGRKPHTRTGYDATSMITRPLPDRVGLLADTLNEFTRRGINILDLRSENDIKTQKLQIYIEIEGHQDNPLVSEALSSIESRVIQERHCIKILGSFPRVDMRVKKIKIVGFIGSGAMSTWFAERLENEGYQTIITGRSSKISPEEMISKADVVMICVPISATSETIAKYGPLLKDGQALILLAGESEKPLETALNMTSEGVELMLVHNLWGPQALTMKDKNASIVRTRRSGSLCNEFESFLYKHGADIYLDSPGTHDLLMGFCQKLPTAISVALAMTLDKHGIDCEELGSHSTLTSLYGVLAMARVHSQNSRTYAEIMATGGQGNKIVSSFIENLQFLFSHASKGEIKMLLDILEKNKNYFPSAFLESKMRQAKAVDAVLSSTGFKSE